MIVCGLSMGARLTSSSPLQRFERDVRYRLAAHPEQMGDELQFMASLQGPAVGGGTRGRWSTSLDGPARGRLLTPAPHGERAASPHSVWELDNIPGSELGDGPEEDGAELDHFNRFCRLKPGQGGNQMWEQPGGRASRSRRSSRRSPRRRQPSMSGSRPSTRERPSTRDSGFSVRTSASFAGSEASRATSVGAPVEDAPRFWPAVGDAAALPNTLGVTESVRVAHLEATRAQTASETRRRPSSGTRAAQHWATNAPSPSERRGANSWWIHLGKDRTGKAGADIVTREGLTRPWTPELEQACSNPDVQHPYGGSPYPDTSTVAVVMGTDGFPAATGASGRQVRKPGAGGRPRPRTTSPSSEGVISGGVGDAGDLGGWGPRGGPTTAKNVGLRAWTPE